MKDREGNHIRYITEAAAVAALYTVLTLVSGMLGLSSGQIQVRLSEALCLLPMIIPGAVPGLFAGCFIANVLTGALIPDIIFGSLATLAGAVLTSKAGSNEILGAAGPIFCNTLTVPLILRYAYGVRPLWISFITVLIGELISVGIAGIIVYRKCLHLLS